MFVCVRQVREVFKYAVPHNTVVSKHHVMRPLRGKLKQENYYGFDIETCNNNETFVCCSVWSENEKRFFYSVEEARKYFISAESQGKTFVATNLSFDFAGVFWDSPEWNCFDTIFRSSHMMLATFKKKGHKAKVRFIDTINYVPFGVATLGKILGYGKYEHPEYLGKRAPVTNGEWLEYKRYNMRDAEISCRFMKFLSNAIMEIGGNTQMSIASTALDVYRRKYLTRNIGKESQYFNWVYDFIYSAYYGGRTEAFKRGKISDAFYYDINSLYPHVMRNKYPLPHSVKNVYEPDIEYILEYEGVSECLVTCPEMKYPLLPLRRDKKLVFPVGNFTGTWNNVELREALKLGYKIEPIRQIIYTETFYPFKEYVEDLYNKRLEEKAKNSNMELVYKLLLNSLYGKFAQRHLEDVKIRQYETMEQEELEKYIDGSAENDNTELINGIFITRTTKECESDFVLPILSSYTTSYARLEIYKYLTKYNALYTDTDSIITHKEIPVSSGLGGMKLEEYIETGSIVKPKMYEINGKVKIKGIRRCMYEDFISALEGREIVKEQFMTIKAGIRRGVRPNTVFSVAKLLDIEDTKREWVGTFNRNKLQESKPLKVVM